MGSDGPGGPTGIPPSSQPFSRIMVGMYIVGAPMNLVLLIAYVKHRRELLVQAVDHLFLLIVIIHFGWCTIYAWLQCYVSLFRNGYDGSPTSHLLCQTTGVLLLETSANAILTHALIATERWLTVVRGIADTRPYLLTILGTAELLLVAMAVIQLHSTRQFEPTVSGLYCFFPFVVPDGNYMPLLGTIMATTGCILAAVAILCSYAYIYVKVIRASQRVARHTVVDLSDEIGPPLQRATTTIRKARGVMGSDDHVRKVFYRCLGVVAVFGCTYLILFISLEYRLLANVNVPDWVDALAATLGACDTLITPVMITVMNRKVAEAVAEVVGMQWVFRRGRVQPVRALTVLTKPDEELV
ncbi:hypothetical protein HK101_002591 [Irineochytrium annulatum]|nr:hypothetical protein HK101_002591 [Irineochytrium annulatum]